MIRNDLIADIETVIVSLETTKGYSEFDIIDCMAHIIQQRSKVNQKDLFAGTKKRKTKIIDIPDQAVKLSELFAKLFGENRKPTKPINIAAGARLLMKLFDLTGSWEQVEWAVRYSQDKENIKDKFMPVIWSMDSLLEKYPQLIAHKNRKENKEKNEAFNKNSTNYNKPVRVVVYWDQTSFKFQSYSESRTKCPYEPNCDIEQFNSMTKEARRKYFNVKTKEEMEEDWKKSKEIIKKLKEELK
jgi:hypothetical protein